MKGIQIPESSKFVESIILENLLVEISRILGFGIHKYKAQGL